MTFPCIALVYGARALADTAEATAWARARIDERLRWLPSGSWLFTGGCPDSPDQWAYEWVRDARPDISVEEFRLDDRRWRSVNGAEIAPVEPEETWLRYAPPDAERDRGTPKWPLRRNDALRNATKHARNRGALVSQFGFAAPWAKTHGTQYMAQRLTDTFGSVSSCSVGLGPPSAFAEVERRVLAGLRCFALMGRALPFDGFVEDQCGACESCLARVAKARVAGKRAGDER